MIKEAYCSYEISKLLKEKGFDEPCSSWYMYCGDGSVKKFMLAEPVNHNQYDGFPWTVSRPTHQMVLAWLREIYRIDIVIEISDPSVKDRKYYCIIWDGNNDSYILDLFNSYEETVETALKYTLEKLI